MPPHDVLVLRGLGAAAQDTRSFEASTSTPPARASDARSSPLQRPYRCSRSHRLAFALPQALLKTSCEACAPAPPGMPIVAALLFLAVREVGVITTQLNSRGEDFFKRSATRVAMVAIVAMSQKAPKAPC